MGQRLTFIFFFLYAEVLSRASSAYKSSYYFKYLFIFSFTYLFLTFSFTLGYSQLTNHVVKVSGKEQRDSAIYIHGFVLPQIPLPSKLPHDSEQSSLCL